jgi:hypothetical protein
MLNQVDNNINYRLLLSIEFIRSTAVEFNQNSGGLFILPI